MNDFENNEGNERVPNVIPALEQKKVPISLIIGILLLPIIFAWSVMKKGYSKQARILSLIWLLVWFIFLISTCSHKSESEISVPADTLGIVTSPREWNKTILDPFEEGNDNILMAIDSLKTNIPSSRKNTTVNVKLVSKAPWDYYGKIVAIQGRVIIVSDNPPSDWFSMLCGGVTTSQFVLDSNGVTVEYFCMKSSGNISEGNYITIYGYPVGRGQVDNKMGGSDEHLFIIGDNYSR